MPYLCLKSFSRTGSPKYFEIWYFIADNCFGELSTPYFLTSLMSSHFAKFGQIMLWQCSWYIFLNLSWVFDRDHCRMSNYPILPKNFKTSLRFKENVPCTLQKHNFVQVLPYWEDFKDVQKQCVEHLAKQFLATIYQISSYDLSEGDTVCKVRM